MKYTKNFEKLGLPEDFKFGIELEAFNVKTKVARNNCCVPYNYYNNKL